MTLEAHVSETIRCRAKVAKACLHGKPMIAQTGDPDQSTMDCDGTYIESSNSIVCDPCYIKLGTPPNPVLPYRTA